VALVPTASTIRELRASGHADRTIKEELRDNLLARLRGGGPLFTTSVGFDEQVLPAPERGILAGHDLILLGERGQAKTRLIRHLVDLLDPETPVIDGCEVNDHPYRPICARCRALVAERGEETPVAWIGPDDRYAEKLATPDTSVADLIGDVDPIRVAEGRYLSDELTFHYGLVPRTNRGIVAINELPDLPERIQVALLNVLEERDVQVRGYSLRLPLDVLLVATANPDDYTNRGRIISPLKDRFGAQVRTHYPRSIDDEVAIVAAEATPPPADVDVHVPAYLDEILAELAATLRDSAEVNQRSGVSVRFSIANHETLAASALRRAVRNGEAEAVARPSDLGQVLSAGLGKVEFETFEEGREAEILERLARRALLEVFRRRTAGVDLSGLVSQFDEGRAVETGDLVSAEEVLAQLDAIPGLSKLLAALEVEEESPGLAAAAVEFALEGLHLSRKLDRTELEPGVVRYAAH
jgi:magnesium chelatase subunit I